MKFRKNQFLKQGDGDFGDGGTGIEVTLAGSEDLG